MSFVQLCSRLGGALAALAVSGVLAAPGSPAAGSTLDDCVDLADQQQRLACYDAALGRSNGSGADDVSDANHAPEGAIEAAQGEPVKTAAPPRPPTPTGRSGLGAEQLPTPQRVAQQEAEEASELIDTLSEVGKQVTGRYWFRLANGQRWAQVSPERHLLKTGDSVRIGRTAFGTYHLRRADGGSRSTQVRRLE